MKNKKVPQCTTSRAIAMSHYLTYVRKMASWRSMKSELLEEIKKDLNELPHAGKEPEEIFGILRNVNPTEQADRIIKVIYTWYKKGYIDLPVDSKEIKVLTREYVRSKKQVPELLELEEYEHPGDLSEDLAKLKKKKQESRLKPLEEGNKLIAQQGPYRVWLFDDPSHCIVIGNARWCTKTEGTFRSYTREGPMYLFTKKERLWALLKQYGHSVEFKDPNNRPMTIERTKPIYELIKKVLRDDIPLKGDLMVLNFMNQETVDKLAGELIENKDTKRARAALVFIGGIWASVNHPEVDEMIIQSSSIGELIYDTGRTRKSWSVMGRPDVENRIAEEGSINDLISYVNNARKPWSALGRPDVENRIAEEGTLQNLISYPRGFRKSWSELGRPDTENKIIEEGSVRQLIEYAKNIEKSWTAFGRPEVDRMILEKAESLDQLLNYAKEIIKGPWSNIGLGEEMDEKVSHDPKLIYEYANATSKSWRDMGKPEVEDRLINEPTYSAPYAIQILKKPWSAMGKPEIEQNIMNDVLWSLVYEAAFEQ